MARNSEAGDIFGDLVLACMLLTRIPMPTQDGVRDVARSAWAWPLVGLLVGALAALVATIALALGLPTSLAAVAALGTSIITTGAMHEDGLADTSDGFWGGRTIERRLEIMRDSRIGSYGVLALSLSVLARWTALSALFATGSIWVPLLVAGATSRAVMPIAMHLLPNARDDGLSHGTGRPDRQTVWIGLALTSLVVLLLTGTGLLWIALVTAAALAGMIQISRQKTGGQTGDTLGATQQVCELAVLSTMISLAS